MYRNRHLAWAAVPAVLSLVLLSSLGACSSKPSSAHGTLSTSQVCADLKQEGQTLTAGVLGAMTSLSPTDVPSGLPSEALPMITNAVAQFVTFLRTEASKASDSKLAGALTKAATDLDNEVSQIHSVNDLESMGTNLSSVSGLETYCPGALSQ
jgi:hypothetical protein